jgi:hypothetical protein
MRDHIITTSRPVVARVAPSVDVDTALPRAQARKHTFLGTAFLVEKANRWGHRKLIVLIVATFLPLCLALAVLVGAAWPFLAYGVEAPSTYQPTMLMVTGFFGAPGEHDASGLAHPTVLILLYTDHLTLTELPAGDAKRTSAISTAFVQHGTNPQIVSVVQVNLGHTTKDLIVKVSMNWQSLSPDTFLFDFTSHPEQMSTMPGTPGYTAPEYGLYTVTQGG